MGRLPHEPFWQVVPLTHWASLLQKVAQRFPWQPAKGAHACTAGTVQTPLRQTPTSLALFVRGSQLPGWQTVPLA